MSDANSVRLDEVFRVLADRRRRYVLYYFEETDETVASLTELTDQLLTWENEWRDTDTVPDSQHRKKLRIELHHNHLPRLADTKLIEYDARSETVRQAEKGSFTRCASANDAELQRLFAVFNLPEPPS